MALGIRPTIDFAFKKIFGSPENSQALIGLLHAILQLPNPIVEVTILNPFNYQEFAEAKSIVLDIRCRDSAGRSLNVEIQVAAFPGLLQRLVYYACSMYVEQIGKGHSYGDISDSISICLAGHRIFTDSEQAHHKFEMFGVQSGKTIDRAVAVHTIELTKYNLDAATIRQRTKIEQWAFLLLKAQDCDAWTLRELLPGEEFDVAIDTLEKIAMKTEDRLMYDQREKAQRDYEWVMTSVREEGREEGVEMGTVAGMIMMLQEILGESVSDRDELIKRPEAELLSLKLALQEKLRRRSK